MCERLIKFSPVNMTQMWLLLPLFMFYLEVKDVRTEGKIGCFFNLLVCDKEELCYDDNAFGRCQAGYDEGGGIYRNILTPGTLRLLEQEMKRLFNGGYRWSDDYTQCVLQNILYTEKRHLIYDPGLCSRVLKLPLPTVPLEVTQQLEHVNPEDLAYISFNPSKENTYSEYADETYIPPNDQSRYKNVYAIDGSRDSTNQASRLNRNSYQIPKDTLSGDVEEDEEFKYQKLLEYLQKVLQDVASTLQEEEGENEVSPSQKFPLAEGSFFPDLERKLIYTEGGTEWIPAEDKQKSKNFKEESRKHLTSRLGKNSFNFETKLLDKKPTFVSHFNELGEGRRNDKVWWRPLVRENQNVNIFHRQDDGKSLHDEDHGWLENLKFLEKLSYNPEVREYIQVVSYADPEESRHLVDTYRSSFREDPVIEAFERAMRYDAKKPGQHYAVHEPEPPVIGYKNNMWEPIDMNTQRFNGQISYPSIDVATSERQAFPPFAEDNELALKQLVTKGQSTRRMSRVAMTTETKPQEFVFRDESEVVKSSTDDTNATGGSTEYYEPVVEVFPPPIFSAISESPGDLEPDTAKTYFDKNGQFEAVDSSRAYLLLDGILTMEEGSHLVKFLEKLLKLPRGTFSNIRVKKNQVTFKVNPNPKGLNASTVAEKVEELTVQLQKTTGKSVMSAGIGDKTHFEVINEESSNHRLFILSFVLCGCIVGVLIAVAVVFVIRRHARSRQKLQNLGLPETDATQDYQDLCRQRMASKTNDKPEPVHQSPKRISSLSQSEPSQPSPSSRSSTSSWNEEPLASNMDISTGHMILSYMEDHLNNKDRLDREWEALCAYEPEPCSTSVAKLSQNVNKNRFPDVLPYDHSRVILNDFSNICGSDYINASTITDHDPRNPAYVATQGPLPQTAADFWQMIWEQGSVVVVMLTRLMENGVAMCHRYWPEEGSEIYHIYEVHLVSEHIWCDDYLVRSLYLKNLKTTETRTVTQFHFLSWPDNGVPTSIKALLEFRRKVNKSYRGRSCPIVVHCSDGIGRTGTYCVIDMVLNRMAKGTKEIDIAATLEHIRDQRGDTVKTKAQFEFVLKAIAEEVHAILKALAH